MDRYSNRSRQIRDRTGDRLPDPPGGVGRELESTTVLKLVDSLHQTNVAFLNQIEEMQSTVGVLLGYRDDQPEIRLNHVLLGGTSVSNRQE